ncbi:MAG: dioxygenase [Myxococcales bacterium]|nr:dioxygenase [Myxococcales bacterium]
MTAADHKGAGRTDSDSHTQRMPTVFLPHGGGPWPFVEMGLDRKECDDLASYLRSVRALPPVNPSALLIISAHWEEPTATVMTAEKPPLLFDYYGFPPKSYQLTWPAPGHPQLAQRVQHLLGSAGFQTKTESQRGFDHGTFVPLKLTYPQAEIPTLQLSLLTGLDPRQHLAMGKALQPLRDEGVFIIGSGMSFHNMRGFRSPRVAEMSAPFDEWLRQSVTLNPQQRDQLLCDWSSAPGARLAHPREEHLIPLMVIAGAAGNDRGTVGYQGSMMGAHLSAFHFG